MSYWQIPLFISRRERRRGKERGRERKRGYRRERERKGKERENKGERKRKLFSSQVKLNCDAYGSGVLKTSPCDQRSPIRTITFATQSKHENYSSLKEFPQNTGG